MGSEPKAVPAPSGSPQKTSSARSGKLRLPRRLPLREALLRAFAGAVLAARRAASRAAEDPVRSVHEFRKSIRRARSMVALLRPALGRKAASGLVAELRRALEETSALRDDDVLAATLSGIADGDPELFVEAAEFAARLSSHDRRPRPEKVLERAVRILRPLPPALSVVLARDYSTPELEAGLGRCYRRAQSALEQAQRTRADADFHEWRKRVKELRYAVELLSSSGSRPLKARDKALGDLARDLGEATDLAVLCAQLGAEEAPDAVPAATAGAGTRLRARARDLQRQRADELLARGAPLFTQSPRVFALEVLAERG